MVWFISKFIEQLLFGYFGSIIYQTVSDSRFFGLILIFSNVSRQTSWIYCTIAEIGSRSFIARIMLRRI